MQNVPEGFGSWKLNHNFPVAKGAGIKKYIYWKQRRYEEWIQDENLRQVILDRISCRQSFGVRRAWRVGRGCMDKI